MSTGGVEVTAVTLLKTTYAAHMTLRGFLEVTVQAHLKVLRSDCTGTSKEISFRHAVRLTPHS